jgi:glycosyltransferase involved in cell wall biosynthesis
MKVTLFRDLPSEHWFSMERYADELYGALRECGVDVRAYVLPRPLATISGRAGAWLNHFWRMAIYPVAARYQQGDINHVIDHSYGHLLKRIDPVRTVITCHDLAPLALGAGSGLSRKLWDVSFRAMPGAARIIAISESTRSEIARFTQYPATKISRIYYGVSPDFRTRVTSREIARVRERAHALDRPLILHVGSCEPRKNIEAILSALEAARDLQPMFVQVGGRFSQSQVRIIEEHELKHLVIQIPPARGIDLCGWYQSADVLAFPSWYEGFGMPVLEAMASELPVVTSNATSLPEAAGEAAIQIRPDDDAGLAEAIRSVLRSDSLRSEMKRKGLQHSAEFTWERTARKTATVYRQLAS